MATRQYIGARYVPKFYDYNGSAAWRSGTEYEALTIVTVNGNSYTSKIPVPSSVGSPDQNPEYWVATGLYNQQVEAYRQLTIAVADRVEEVATDTAQGITDEATARANADTALSGDISAEATARENADTALSGDISAEATARENADTALNNSVDNLYQKNYKYSGLKIVGHAGAGNYAPNNTMASYNMAVNLFADAIETDVQMCSDGVPVCHHNPVVNGQVLKNITSAEATQIVVDTAGQLWGEQTIPLFADFLDVCKGANKTAVVEFKWEATGHMVDSDLPYVKAAIDNACYDDVIFISWKADPLESYLQLDPRAKCIWLLSDPTPVSNDNILLAKNKGFYGVGLPTSVNLEFIDYAHSIGLKVNIFTAEAYPTSMRGWINHNVDYVTTNSIFTCGDVGNKREMGFRNIHGSNRGVPMPSKYACTLKEEGYPLPMATITRTDTTAAYEGRLYEALTKTRACSLPIKVQPGDKIIKRSVSSYNFSVTVWNSALNVFVADSGWLSGNTEYTIPTNGEWAIVIYRKNDTDTIDYRDLFALFSMYGGVIKASTV